MSSESLIILLAILALVAVVVVKELNKPPVHTPGVFEQIGAVADSLKGYL